MWRRGGGDDDDEVASSFASSQSRSADSSADGHAQADWRRHAVTHDDEDEDNVYDDEDFEGYSDEFESDDEGHEADTRALEEEKIAWTIGDRVQVYWEEERTWFDGVVAQVDRVRCFVDYTDGEQQWENGEGMRAAPPDQASDAVQLEKILVDAEITTLVGRRVVVYWDDERDWFDGRITQAAQVDDVYRIHVLYDDGDDQWILQASFRDVIVIPVGATDEDVMTESSDCTTGRVVTPRPYVRAVENHFEPIRVARPYKPALHGHIGSVLMPRSWDRRSYYQPRVVAQLDCEPHARSSKQASLTAPPSQECYVQTEVIFNAEHGQPSPPTASA